MSAALATEAAPKQRQGLTGEDHEWVVDTFGVDPKKYQGPALDAKGDMKAATHDQRTGAAPAHAAAPAPGGAKKAAPGGSTLADKGKKVVAAGKAIKNFVSEHCKVEVKEVSKDPPKYALTTTINFKAGIDKKGSKSVGDDKTGTLELSAGIKVEAEVIASYTEELSQDEAEHYMKCIAANGKGGKGEALELLQLGFGKGWQQAKEAYQKGAHLQDAAKRMKDGSAIHQQASAEAGGNLGAKAEKGGFGASIDLGAYKKRKNVLDIENAPKGMVKVTAAVDDEKGAAAGGSVTGKGVTLGADESVKTGQGQSVVLILDPKSSDFDKQFKAITDAKSYADLAQIAKTYKSLVDTMEQRTHDEAGGGGKAGYKGVGDAKIHNKSVIDEKNVMDRDGNSKSFTTDSSMTTETELSHDKSKLAFSKGSQHHGDVKDGKAEGAVGETGTDTLKTLFNAARQVLATKSLKPLEKPEDLKVEDARHSHKLDYGDDELKAICGKAQNVSRWNSMGGKENKQLWAQTGAALRAATTMEKYQVAKFDPIKVEQALSVWMASGSGDALAAIEGVLRTMGEAPKGHDQSFPKGSEKLKAVWGEVVAHNPLPGIKDALAKAPGAEGLKAAVAAVKDLREKLKGLLADLKKNQTLWDDAPVRFAEMADLVTSRLGEIDKTVQEFKKSAAALVSGPAKGAPAKPDAEDVSAMLETYKREIAAMQGYHDGVWKVFKVIENTARPKFDEGLMKDLKDVEHSFFLWDAGYRRTEKLHETLKTSMKMDDEALWKLDTKETVAVYDAAKVRVLGHK